MASSRVRWRTTYASTAYSPTLASSSAPVAKTAVNEALRRGWANWPATSCAIGSDRATITARSISVIARLIDGVTADGFALVLTTIVVIIATGAPNWRNGR